MTITSIQGVYCLLLLEEALQPPIPNPQKSCNSCKAGKGGFAGLSALFADSMYNNTRAYPPTWQIVMRYGYGSRELTSVVSISGHSDVLAAQAAGIPTLHPMTASSRVTVCY